MALLREYRLEKDTVVIVASDNGAQAIPGRGYEFFRSNGNLRGAKAQVYEGGIRAPLIVRWPGRVCAGSSAAKPPAGRRTVHFGGTPTGSKTHRAPRRSAVS